MRVTFGVLTSPSFLPQRRLGPSWGTIVAGAARCCVNVSNWAPASPRNGELVKTVVVTASYTELSNSSKAPAAPINARTTTVPKLALTHAQIQT